MGKQNGKKLKIVGRNSNKIKTWGTFMKIKNIKYGITNGGLACGPVDGSVNAVIEYEDNKGTRFLSNVEYSGIPSFYLSNIDIYDLLIKEDLESADKYHIESFADVELGEYLDIYEELKNKKSDDSLLLKLLICVTVMDKESTEKLIKQSVGKDIKEIKMPNLRMVLEDYL